MTTMVFHCPCVDDFRGAMACVMHWLLRCDARIVGCCWLLHECGTNIVSSPRSRSVEGRFSCCSIAVEPLVGVAKKHGLGVTVKTMVENISNCDAMYINVPST